MANANEAVLLIDWLNLSIHLKNQRLAFGSDLVADLIKVSRDECLALGDVELVRAHFVGEHFAPSVEVAIKNTLIARHHKTRTAKEQADLLLAVLAMDHIHAATGSPRLFILATGDQDFVPLIERMIEARAQVILIVASTKSLSPEYRSIAAQQNVKLLSITDAVTVQPLPDADADSAGSQILGLYRVCLAGGILGGDQSRNIRMLNEWGLMRSRDPDVEVAGWIQQFSRMDSRKVAVPARGEHGNRTVVARRTTLNFANDMVSAAVEDADWVLRRAGNVTKLPTVGDLGTGRFGDDDGRRLNRTITALKNVGWLVERSDSRFEARLEWAVDGLLEPLWRIVCEINRRAYAEHTEGVSRDKLFQALRSTPIAFDTDRKGGTIARDAIEYAKRVGVIDAIPADGDGYALAVVEAHPLAQRMATCLRTLGQLFADRVSTDVPEHEVLAWMRERDERGNGQVVFGYDLRDRQRILRVFRRANLLNRALADEPMIRLRNSDWLRRLLA
jgi:hypothetical protein